MKINRPVPFRLQHDRYDCGVACLRNILSYYKADISPGKLREWSGDGHQGATLPGLHQAASQAGFKARGARAGGIAGLKDVRHPCILHVSPDGSMLHYVVYYPAGTSRSISGAVRPADPDTRDTGPFRDTILIGDPAKGLLHLSPEELEKIWPSQTLLLLEPGDRLSQWQQQRQKKVRWLWQTLKEDVHLLYVALALGAICSLLGLSTAVFSQQLIDHILPGRRPSTLYLGLGPLGLLLILKVVFSFLRQDLLIRQGYGFHLRGTGRFYRSILHLNKSFFDHRQTGDLTARLGDTLRIQQAVSYILGDMVIQSLLLLITLTFLFIYCWPIALGCLAMIPVIFGVVKYFEGDIIRGQQEVMIRHARNGSNWLGKTRIRFGVFLELITSLFLLSIICWASLSVLQGHLHIGGLLAIIQLAGLLMSTAITVALTNLHVQEATVALDRLYEFTMLEPEFPLPPDPGPTLASGAAPPGFQNSSKKRRDHSPRWRKRSGKKHLAAGPPKILSL